jgi:CRISPR-associated protein Cas2
MMVLVSYDVATTSSAGRRRLRRVAKICQNYGQRVQDSVFECVVEPAEWTSLKLRLLAESDEKEDSLRFYFLGANWRGKVKHHGAKPTLDVQEDPLIV